MARKKNLIRTFYIALQLNLVPVTNILFSCISIIIEITYSKIHVSLGAQLAITCSKLTIETLEQSVKYVQC